MATFQPAKVPSLASWAMKACEVKTEFLSAQCVVLRFRKTAAVRTCHAQFVHTNGGGVVVFLTTTQFTAYNSQTYSPIKTNSS